MNNIELSNALARADQQLTEGDADQSLAILLQIIEDLDPKG